MKSFRKSMNEFVFEQASKVMRMYENTVLEDVDDLTDAFVQEFKANFDEIAHMYASEMRESLGDEFSPEISNMLVVKSLTSKFSDLLKNSLTDELSSLEYYLIIATLSRMKFKYAYPDDDDYSKVAAKISADYSRQYYLKLMEKVQDQLHQLQHDLYPENEDYVSDKIVEKFDCCDFTVSTVYNMDTTLKSTPFINQDALIKLLMGMGALKFSSSEESDNKESEDKDFWFDYFTEILAYIRLEICACADYFEDPEILYKKIAEMSDCNIGTVRIIGRFENKLSVPMVTPEELAKIIFALAKIKAEGPEYVRKDENKMEFNAATFSEFMSRCSSILNLIGEYLESTLNSKKNQTDHLSSDENQCNCGNLSFLPYWRQKHIRNPMDTGENYDDGENYDEDEFDEDGFDMDEYNPDDCTDEVMEFLDTRFNDILKITMETGLSVSQVIRIYMYTPDIFDKLLTCSEKWYDIEEGKIDEEKRWYEEKVKEFNAETEEMRKMIDELNNPKQDNIPKIKVNMVDEPGEPDQNGNHTININIYRQDSDTSKEELQEEIHTNTPDIIDTLLTLEKKSNDVKKKNND